MQWDAIRIYAIIDGHEEVAISYISMIQSGVLRHMKCIFAGLLLAGSFLIPFPVHSQEIEPTHGDYASGKVIEIVDEAARFPSADSLYTQRLRVLVEQGSEKGRVIDVGHTYQRTEHTLKVGMRVVIIKTTSQGTTAYSVADTYRLPAIGIIAGIFFVLVLIFARWRGVSSLLGLVFSIAVLWWYIIPLILRGSNPLVISITGSLAILSVSLYLSHGLNTKTTIALVSTFITLILSALFSFFCVSIARLYGGGTEEAILLQVGNGQSINLAGILLGGMIVGILGILDDATITQAASVYELKRANKKLTLRELYSRGISIGRERIASLVNTLALAYAGVSLPLFLLFFTQKTQPWWVVLNGEFVAEEVVRTFAGSVALVLAIPIATFLAAYFFSRKESI